MRFLLILILAGVFAASAYGADEDNPTKRKKLAQTEPVKAPLDTAKGEQRLSTETSGLDSLGVMPTELETESNGGTRRIALESEVFNRHEPVYYKASDLRDPFRALVVKDPPKPGTSNLLLLEDAVLTGVVWSEGKYLAMVRDKDGKSFFLREGDSVVNGKVLYVGQTEAVFEVTNFGDYARITLKVQGS